MEGRVGATMPEDEGLARRRINFNLLVILHIELGLSTIKSTVQIDDKRKEASLCSGAREATIVMRLEFGANFVCNKNRTKKKKDIVSIHSLL